MKVMVLVEATERSEAGEFGSAEDFAATDRFNEKLVEAGVLLAGDGLQPSSKGKRVAFDTEGGATVIDGPFAETKELIAGFSIWEVASMEEAVEWVRRSPLRDCEVELRKVLDAEDFADTFPAEIAAAESGCSPNWPPSSSDLSDPAGDRRGLAHRVRQADRRPGPRRSRCRAGRGPGAGRPRRSARAVAAVRCPGQPGRLAHGRGAPSRRRGVDAIRRAATLQTKVELLGRELRDHEAPMDEIEFDPHIDDDVLRLMFTACHPVLSVEARVALTLKMVAGRRPVFAPAPGPKARSSPSTGRTVLAGTGC